MPAVPSRRRARRPGRAGAVALVLSTVLATAGGLLSPVPASASDVASRPPDGVLTVDGRGFGHGRGLSQYGAYGAALRGLSHEQVLGFYYAGTTLGQAPAGSVRRVLITDEDADAVVTNAPGLVVRDVSSGAAVGTGGRADWSTVRVRQDGAALRAEALQGSTWVTVLGPTASAVRLEGPPSLRLHHPTGQRTYRGQLTVSRSGTADKPVYVVNTVGLEDYVRGVTPAEMPPSWHPEALQAQAVAARSYGAVPCPQPSRWPATSLYDVVDTTACQVYVGSSRETPSTDAAATATAGQVLRYGGQVLRAEFSASNGGLTVGNGAAFPAKEDPYDVVGAQAAGSTVHRWTGVRVPLTRFEDALGTGLVREVRVLSRDGRGEWGGRVLTVRLVGDRATVDISGDRFRSLAGLRSNWFDLVSPIDVKHAQLGGSAGWIGPPITAEVGLTGGRFRQYRNGSIYWSPATGAHEVHGSVRDRWGRTGWEAGPLGYPTTDETGTPDGRGRYNHFTGGSVYWTAATGAQDVRGSIRTAWSRVRWEAGPLGYPVTGETATPDGVGRYNHFERGSIYWSPTTDAHEVLGSIREVWRALRWESGPLRYPTTGQRVTADGVGRRNHFQGGAVYWSPSTGAHAVQGSIRVHWDRTGAEAGPLGYPVSDEYDVPGGRRSDFQRGSIVWDRATGTTRTV